MKKFFSLFASLLMAASMMADVVTINAATDITGIESGAQSGLTQTIQGVRIDWEGAYYNTADNQDIRVYADKTMTLTSSVDIAKVEIVGFCKAGWNLTTTAGTITTGATYSSETTKADFSDPLIVIDNISNPTITLKCNKQLRAYQIRVTLDADGPVAPPVVADQDTIVIEATQGVYWDDATADEGWWQVWQDGGEYELTISNLDNEQAAGKYTVEDLDMQWTYYKDLVTGDSISFVSGEVNVTVFAEDSVLVEGSLVGDDGNLYVVNLLYWEPKSLHDGNLAFGEGMIDDSLADYGLISISTTDQETYQLVLGLIAFDDIEGDWTEDDIYGPYSFYYDVTGLWMIYSMNITIEKQEDGSYTVIGTVLCYNNTMYNVSFTIPAQPEGIEDVLVGEESAKFIQNGQLIIRKNGVHYNAAGQRLQ